MSETQALLVNSGSFDDFSTIVEEDPSLLPSGKESQTTVLEEMKVILRTSVPLSVTFFLQYSMSVVSIFTVSRIGKRELAAVSLATMTFNITSSIFTGMATCLETFCSQAYGAKKYNLVGIYFQRCFLVISIFSIPLILLWWFSSSLLRYIVTDYELAVLAESYLRVTTFCIPAYIFFETSKRYLQAQNIFVAGQYVLFIVAPINILLNYELVWNKYFGIGFLGAPLATSLSYWLAAGMMFVYMFFIDGHQCWFGIDHENLFKEWERILPMALNGTAMLLSEFVAFEILTLSSARFGTSTLAAQSIASTLATLCFQIPFAVSVACATRIASLLGAGRSKDAIISTKTSYYLSLAISLTNFSLLFFARFKVIVFFTSDAKVIKIADTILFILSLNQLWDCPNIVGAGILRAQGRQSVGSKLNIIAYYIFALPLALYLGFTCGMNVKGLWIGLGIGIFFLACSELFMVLITDWVMVVDSAISRT
ncbi:unnamed protein product [Pichia kudriavzevii]